MTERTVRKNAQLLEGLRAAAIAILTWGGMTAVRVQPSWLSVAVGVGAGLIALANAEIAVLLALTGLCIPLIAAQPIVGALIAIVVFVAERYLGGQGAVGFLLIGLAVAGAFYGPVWAAAALAGCLLGPGEGALMAAAACVTVEALGILIGRQALTVVLTGAPLPAIVSFAKAPATLLSTQWIVAVFKSLSVPMVSRLTASLSHVSIVPALIAQVAVWMVGAAVAGAITRSVGTRRSLPTTLTAAAVGVGVLAAGDALVRVAFGLPMLPGASGIALVSSLVVALGIVAGRDLLFPRVPIAVETTQQPQQVTMAAEDADVDELLRLIATAEDKLASKHTAQRVVLITDMKSFSRMTEEDGSVATAKAIQRHRDLLVPIITRFNGCGKSTGGDGVVAAFESASGALNAAVEGQRALAEYNASHERERDVLVRMGLADGEVVLDNGGRPFIGAGLNLAARVMNLADGGQVFASEDVIKAGATGGGQRSHIFGTFELKNIASPIAIGEVLWADGQQPRDPRAPEAAG